MGDRLSGRGVDSSRSKEILEKKKGIPARSGSELQKESRSGRQAAPIVRNKESLRGRLLLRGSQAFLEALHTVKGKGRKEAAFYRLGGGGGRGKAFVR